MIGTIYSITRIKDGKTYIGQTILKVEQRWKNHEEFDSYIGRAIRKSGKENFLFEVLQTFKHEDKHILKNILNKAEIYYIAVFDSFNSGFNLTTGGYSTCFSEDVCNKISLKGKERWNKYHEIHEWSGYKKKIGPRKIGSGRSGIKHTKEHVENNRKAQTGKKHSEETKKKMSERSKNIDHKKYSSLCKRIQNIQTGEIYFSMREYERKTGLSRKKINLNDYKFIV